MTFRPVPDGKEEFSRIHITRLGPQCGIAPLTVECRFTLFLGITACHSGAGSTIPPSRLLVMIPICIRRSIGTSVACVTLHGLRQAKTKRAQRQILYYTLLSCAWACHVHEDVYQKYTFEIELFSVMSLPITLPPHTVSRSCLILFTLPRTPSKNTTIFALIWSSHMYR